MKSWPHGLPPNVKKSTAARRMRFLRRTAPPYIPSDRSQRALDGYKRALEAEFGWAHLTLGGTTANIEALWAARATKYLPLAIWDCARTENLEIRVKLADTTDPESRGIDIRSIEEPNLIGLVNIRPNESIYLNARFVEALRVAKGLSVSDASDLASELLQESEWSLSKGVSKVFGRFPPRLFVCGTAHYSVIKAADILGIGRDCVELISPTEDFRLDVDDLNARLDAAIQDGCVPLAVIGILGSTEEGAIDPIHKMLELRADFEVNRRVSWWMHTDAAWGGYLRSLFVLPEAHQHLETLARVGRQIGIEPPSDDLAPTPAAQEWHNRFFGFVEGQVMPTEEGSGEVDDQSERLAKRRRSLWKKMKAQGLGPYVADLEKFIPDYRHLGLSDVATKLTTEDQVESVNAFVSDDVQLDIGAYQKTLKVQWGSEEVCSAFLELGRVDSITVDPHKMGYMDYPCGMVAFKNDRVRHLLLQKTPYLTSVRQDVLVHSPPQHLDRLDEKGRTIVEAFAPFIVEGSRPGAAAAALWLTLKAVPPNGAGAWLRNENRSPVP